MPVALDRGLQTFVLESSDCSGQIRRKAAPGLCASETIAGAQHHEVNLTRQQSILRATISCRTIKAIDLAVSRADRHHATIYFVGTCAELSDDPLSPPCPGKRKNSHGRLATRPSAVAGEMLRRTFAVTGGGDADMMVMADPMMEAAIQALMEEQIVQWHRARARGTSCSLHARLCWRLVLH